MGWSPIIKIQRNVRTVAYTTIRQIGNAINSTAEWIKPSDFVPPARTSGIITKKYSRTPSYLRTIAYIDGYNFHHAIDQYDDPSLKWCDFTRLIESNLHNRDNLDRVNYYTAPPLHLNRAKQQHYKAYTEALKARGVKIIEGKFKSRQRRITLKREELELPPDIQAQLPKSYFKAVTMANEEKETDVHIATDLIWDAYEERYDKAVILSADSDLVPAVKCILSVRPRIRVQVMSMSDKVWYIQDADLPQRNAKQIRKTRIEKYQLLEYRLPNDFEAPDGTTISAPAGYRD